MATGKGHLGQTMVQNDVSPNPQMPLPTPLEAKPLTYSRPSVLASFTHSTTVSRALGAEEGSVSFR